MATKNILLVLSLSLLPGSVPVHEAAAMQPTEVKKGAPLPAFESVDDEGRTWKSSDHIGQKVLVLYFYPGDFTGGCTKQAQAYREGLAQIEALGAEVVGVSGDEVATHKLFKETYGLTHALLADREGEVAKLLGMPVKAGGKVRATGPDRKPLLDAEGKRIDIQRPVTLARWTLVVGRDGKVASLRNKVNPVTDVEEVRKLVETLAK
jgi:peroxiredoxin Q/BCP